MTDDAYAQLFNARGHRYHAAMARYPDVRAAEFRQAVQLAGIAPGDRVADIPCGGGYLARYLPDGVQLHSIDSSDLFVACGRDDGTASLLHCPLDAVPLPDACLDHVISLAGLHHVADRHPFWRECARLLRPGGVLTVCDVAAGSAVAGFLDTVVDRHTATGHRGIYFTDDTVGELAQAGFRVEVAAIRPAPWRAPDAMTLAGFCHLLFGLDGIDAAQLLPLLAATPGIRADGDGCVLAWELMNYRAIRC